MSSDPDNNERDWMVREMLLPFVQHELCNGSDGGLNRYVVETECVALECSIAALKVVGRGVVLSCHPRLVLPSK
jgi:hypothetical protein